MRDMPLHDIVTDAPSAEWTARASVALTSEEQAEADQVARRLLDELRSAITLLPSSEQSASAMSRALSLDRATCQRLVASTRRLDAGIEALVQLPGVRGLQQFVEQLRGHLGLERTKQAAAGVAAAIERLEELTGKLGGSQRVLRARLASTRAGVRVGEIFVRGGADDSSNRSSLFDAATAITGRWSETAAYVSIVRPVPGHPDTTEAIRCRAMLGHRARPDAVPLEVGATTPLTIQPAGTPSFAALERSMSDIIVPEFSTRPLPRVVGRGDGHRMTYTIDLSSASMRAGDEGSEAEADAWREQSFDIVMAMRSTKPDKHPATLSPPIGEMWNLVNFPARHMVYDVYLHRDIAAQCRASLEIHLFTPESEGHLHARWSTRFPGGPSLVDIKAWSPESVSTPASPRHPELTRYLFDKSGWNPRDFVGFRCLATYPIWRSGYCMRFDFTEETDE